MNAIMNFDGFNTWWWIKKEMRDIFSTHVAYAGIVTHFFFSSTSRQTCEIMLLLFYYQVGMILMRLTLQAVSIQ